MYGYSVFIACMWIIATRRKCNLYLATMIRLYIVPCLYGFSFAVFRIFAASYKRVFVLVRFARSVFVCLCVDIISYIRTGTEEDLVIDFIYTLYNRYFL